MRFSKLTVRMTLAFSLCLSLIAGAAYPATNEKHVEDYGNQTAHPLRIVTTANPNLFPLLVAMNEDNELDIQIVPVGSSSEVVEKMNSGQGDVLLSMTYTAAELVTSGKVPNLKLVDVDFWNGFSIVSEKDAQIHEISQLSGKGVLVSGPVSGGKGGGPDLLFQAALRHGGLADSDIMVCYLPVMQAVPILIQQQAMNNNQACGEAASRPPIAISLVEPAASGAVFESKISTSSKGELVKSIDLQDLFGPYHGWPKGQLPHGGISVPDHVLNDPARLTQLRHFLEIYHAGVKSIISSHGRPLAMMKTSRTISSGIEKYFGQFGLTLPPAVIAVSLRTDSMNFDSTKKIIDIQDDLQEFLTDVVRTKVPASFFHQM